MAKTKEQIPITKDLKRLAYNVAEDKHNCIVEYQGNFYYIGEDEDWPYKDECELEYEVGAIESNLLLATRRSIGTATLTHSQKPYILERNLTPEIYSELKDNIHNVKCRWESKLPNEVLTSSKAYLPDSENTVYKEVLSLDNNKTLLKDKRDDEKPDFIVYDEKHKTNFCIRQVCKLCEYHKTCVKNITVEKKDLRIINIDFQAQEPRGNLLNNPGEANWRKVFQNDSLKKDQILLVYLDTIFKSQFRVDIERDLRYQEFLDKMFFMDRTMLYELNTHILTLKIDPNNKETKARLNEMIEELHQYWQEFIK